MVQLPWFLLALTSSVLALREGTLKSRAPTKDNFVSAAWWAAWHSTDFPLSRVSWSKYTHMTYAFAITTPNSNALALDVSDERLLPQFVSLAHQHNVIASISVGGWTGSRYFSPAVASASNRTAFVNAVVKLVEKYDLDGVDFDWEYPGMQGLGCNDISPDDTANFLTFLRELRETSVGKKLVLTAAVYVTPFADATGNPSADVSGFADVFDYIAIMNYDVRVNPAIGAGSRSPLDDTCAPSGAKWGSAVSSVAGWNKAGIPFDKLVLGVPAHGHSYDVSPAIAVSRSNSSQLNEFPSYTAANRKIGDKWDGEGGKDSCGVTYGPGGVYTYWGLIEKGFLKKNGSPEAGIVYRYDDCSETPYVYNPDTRVYVSYENQRSFAAKGDFIHNTGLRGFAMWEAGGDRNDTLLDAIIDASLNGNPSVRTDKAKSQAVVPSSRESTPSSESAPGGSPGGSPSRWNPTTSLCLSALTFVLSLSLSCAL